MSQVHPLARTTPRTRTEIKASTASLTELAERYNITVATARKWKGREHAQDRSHRPHKLSTTLNPAQELLAVELRRTLLLRLADRLAVHSSWPSTAPRDGSSCAATATSPTRAVPTSCVGSSGLRR